MTDDDDSDDSLMTLMTFYSKKQKCTLRNIFMILKFCTCLFFSIKQMGAHLIIPGGTRVIDATGKYVFPGGIDANVHFETPYVKVSTYRTTWHGVLLRGGHPVHMGSFFNYLR